MLLTILVPNLQLKNSDPYQKCILNEKGPELYSKMHSVKCSYDSSGRWQQGTTCHSTTGTSLLSDTAAPHLPMQTSAAAGYCVTEHLSLFHCLLPY